MIAVTGGRAKQRQIVKRAAEFAWNYLMPRIKKCDIEIALKKLKDVQGYCLDCDDRLFDLEIDSRLEGDDLLTCVFHEMVHVKQGVRNELKDVSYLEKKWKGEIYINVEYDYNHPWEEEAYRLQEVILEEWKKK
jgi:hypothetical protein